MENKTQKRSSFSGSIGFVLAAGSAVCLDYNVFYFELSLPNGSVAQVLDVMDYLPTTS